MSDGCMALLHQMKRLRKENEELQAQNVNITQDDSRRSLHQLVKRSRTNALTLPSIRKIGITDDGICLMQYELNWDLKHQAWKDKPRMLKTLNNYIQMTTLNHQGRSRQLMTLNIGNDVLICKDVSKAIVATTYVPLTKNKNIITVQNIKLQENETLKDSMKQFRQANGLLTFTLENPRHLLSEFNGATTTSLGDVVLLIQVDPITLSVWVLVVDDLSPYNDIIGRVELESGHPASKEVPSGAIKHKGTIIVTKSNGERSHLWLIRSNHCPSHTT
ncbi:hypothetical protein CK203_088204 [Vitis vinifera]|uniref:Uncharacterized protein n=1 Tax=Vitis vinifera TaxID=29760 RepID=A0A438FJN2_VITVI|nr:hypothetical protein CK203_088204 [Vitis vinifera]